MVDCISINKGCGFGGERRNGAVKGAIYLNPTTRQDACSQAAHIPCYGLPVTAAGSICDEYAQKIMIGSAFGAAETKARTSREKAHPPRLGCGFSATGTRRDLIVRGVLIGAIAQMSNETTG